MEVEVPQQNVRGRTNIHMGVNQVIQDLFAQFCFCDIGLQ